ncbi:MAG: hypothetical protein WAK17_12305 [Candidatus Nitrosopolaris sp.]|jgi:hypothetical protein
MALLPPELIKRRQDLTAKLRLDSISYEEAEELRTILQKEQEQAEAANDFVAIFAILGLLALIAIILSKEPKKKKKSRRLLSSSP